jgi:hypothetical protein
VEESQILARLGRGERVDHYETVRRRSDGHFIDVSLCVSPVRDTEGRVSGRMASEGVSDANGCLLYTEHPGG